MVAHDVAVTWFACVASPYLDSNPAWLLGPTANRFAHIVWVGFDSSAVRWGPLSCLLGLPPPLLWRAERGLLSFSCLGHVRAVLRVARVGAPRVGCVRVVPVHLWLGRDQRIARGSGTCPSWGVVAGCGGVGCVCGVGMPRDCACWVRLRGFLVFGGAFCCAHRAVRLFVCRLRLAVSRVACLLRFWSFVGYCGGARFVSALALPVMWFMPVCVSVRLTATVIVVYCLLCKGRFWQFAARFCAPGCSR